VASDEAARPGSSRVVGDAATRLARYYDLDVEGAPGDLERYQALADAEGGPLLELAAGTGRLAIPLALHGHDVTGVDLDPAMLRRASARWTGVRAGAADGGRLELIESDLLDLELGPRFAMVIIALNSLTLLGSRERQAAALRVAARHLRPRGLLVVDIWLPDQDDLALYDGRLNLEWERTDTETGQRVAKIDAARHASATGEVELVTWFDAWPVDGGPVTRVSRTDHLRLVTGGELAAMAEGAGLRVEALEGDHEGTPFGAGSERAVLLARLV
jgi:SAM-dependent methyltransferase